MLKKRKSEKEGKIETENKSTNNVSYTAKDIYVLEGLEPVRKRPAMYIGSTGSDGLHHLIWEVVDNSIDEAMMGYATNIVVEFLSDGKISVTDNGRGIPVDIHPQTKKSALETVMCTLHAGGKFGGESYKVAGGLHGVGVSVVNALSEWLRVEVCRGGYLYVQEYKRGVPMAPVKKTEQCFSTGTKVVFVPDVSIFRTVEFNHKRILDHLRQQAYLTKGIKIVFVDYSVNPAFYYAFSFSGGIKSFVEYVNKDGDPPIQSKIFYTHKEKDNIDVEVALYYTEGIETHEFSFANNIHTVDGGMHITGFRSALTRTINDYIRSNNYIKEAEENLTGDDVREGLIAVVSVKLREPQFEGQTKARLGNPESRSVVEAVVNEAFKEFLEKYPSDGRKIAEKCLLAAKARMAAKAARETILRKGALEGLTLPGKLADCQTKKIEEAELFIVEGDSAGGSAKQGRDRRFQAILPLRGKILNVEKAQLHKMFSNTEIRSLIVALGTAIADEFNISKLRYGKIILMTDADVDGSHIRTLLLTLFYRHLLQIIENGKLYLAQPPLYRIQKGREVYYAYNDEDKIKTIKLLGEESGINIQRYKGLGEMNPDQLWETTMDPNVRRLKIVTIEDAKEADRLFDILMGSNVEPRKRFIQIHAASVKNLDI
ncbi:MAG: DNA topoisomerase (ATP-hydrolyzing) subunit B [Candidatus Liptonbacteria bacterium]|nr:DNA topoisomerase (ATP-hydrolyzing) subunit B [Candidatus Liptonbacteria bacterium]